ncbi:uncharacterized protein PHACADRAFT_95079, partial [Phanerochaete carnosa HHB-10118-sp]
NIQEPKYLWLAIGELLLAHLASFRSPLKHRRHIDSWWQTKNSAPLCTSDLPRLPELILMCRVQLSSDLLRTSTAPATEFVI